MEYQKKRTNIIYIKDKSYTMNEIAEKLLLSDKSRSEKERTSRDLLTVERIAASYAEETVLFLRRHSKFVKIKDLGALGFTKSFFCHQVYTDRIVAAKVYKSYINYAKTWTTGNPQRFSEKMKNYYISYKGFTSAFFEDVEKDLEVENKTKGKK